MAFLESGVFGLDRGQVLALLLKLARQLVPISDELIAFPVDSALVLEPMLLIAEAGFATEFVPRGEVPIP